MGPSRDNMYVCAQSCLTLCDHMDCSPPGSSVRGISQARKLECVAISSSRGIFPTQGSNLVSYVSRWILYHRATWEAQTVPLPSSAHLLSVEKT